MFCLDFLLIEIKFMVILEKVIVSKEAFQMKDIN